ncbi:MAG: MBG domain-containing protein [Ferruginibacter sp.]
MAISALVSNTGTASRNYQVRYGWGASPTFANATNGTVTNLGTGATSNTATIPAPGNTTTTLLTIRISGYGASSGGTTQFSSIALTGANQPLQTGPSLSSTSTSISNLTYTFGSGPSAASSSFDITGSNLTGAPGNITFTKSNNIEVYDGSTWQTANFTKPYSSASFSATGYQVRLKAGLAVGTYSSESLVVSGGGVSSNLTINVSGSVTAAAPSNDNCSGATALTLGAAAISGDGATATQSIAAGSCNGDPNDDLWYSFTTTSAGTYTITVDGSTSYDAVVELRSGACNGTYVTCIDGTLADGIETLSSSLSASTTYYVRVYDYYTTPATTTFTIKVDPPSATLSTSGSSLAFGSLASTTTSTSQSVNLSGSFLTGAPGNITVTAPSTDFQVSNNNSSWGPTTTIAYSSSTLAATPVYVRFTPQSSGAKSGNVTFSGGGAASPPTVALTGTGTLTAPVANSNTSPQTTNVNPTSFTANWSAVTGATGYRLDVLTALSTAEEDFNDGNFTANPVWSGSTSSYAIQTASTLPSGLASTDGSYLGSNASVGSSALTTPSTEVNEWKFSLGSTTYDPSSSNNFGAILMSSAAVSDITSSFNGYYLRVGLNSGANNIELWRSSNTTKTKLGSFSTADYQTGGLQNGVNLRVTRNSSGVFELFYAAGFTYASTPTTSAGTITDATHSTSSYFGVYTAFTNASATRRVYIDNIALGTGTFVSGYNNLSVGGTTQNVSGLTANTTYYYRVRGEDANTTTANSNVVTVVTTSPSILPATNTFTAFTTTYGTASADQTVSVTGSGLSADITATAATNFEVSNGGAYGPTTTFTQSGGSASGTLHVRLKSDAPVSGSYNGITAVTLTSTGATTRTYTTAATGNAISAAVLTVTADNKSKGYDGNTYSGGYSSQITGYVNGENSGVVTGSVTYSGTAIAATAAGSYTITPVTSGLSAANYTFAPVNGTLTITGVNETTADFRTKQAGNLSSAATWEYNGGGGGYVNATAKPGTGNNVDIRHNVTFDEGFTVGAGKTLKVSAGTANFNSQLVTFKSTASGTASFGQLTGSVTGDNNVTVERYIPNGNRSWRLLSSSTHTSGQTIRQAWMEGDANPSANQNNAPGYGTIITAVAAQVANGFDAVSPSTSIRNYNGSVFVSLLSVNVPLASTSGYFMYIRGDRSVTPAGTNTSSTTLRNHGTLYKGDQTGITVPANTFGLIGNVYASEIDFATIGKSNIVNTLYIWDAKMGATGGYETFPGIDNYAASTGGGSWAKDEINSKIQSGQAFFAAATNAVAGGTITLTESSKTTTSSTKGLRPAAPAVVSKLKTRLFAGDKAYDGNLVVFDNKYQNTIDANDAPKFDNPGENFAIVSEGKQLAAEARQPIGTEATSIAYAMKNMKQRDYALEFTATNLGSGEAYLEDKYLGTKTPVSLSGVTKVSFSVTADPQSAAAGRFQLVLRPAAVPAVDNRIAAISVYPNPVETGSMTVQFVKQAKGKYNLKLVDLAGRVVYSSVREHAGGSAAQSVLLPSTISRDLTSW